MQDKELKADLEELKSLETSAHRQNVKNILKQEIKRLEQSLQIVDLSFTKLEKANKPVVEPKKEASDSPSEEPKTSTSLVSGGIYEMLSKYSWDQTEEFVK